MDSESYGFLDPTFGFVFLPCRPLSHTPPLSVLTTSECVWSNSNLMNLLIFPVWHPDTAQISTSKVSQFVLILKIWPLVKQLIRSDVQRFGLSSLCLCLMNCGIPLLTLKVKKEAGSSQIEFLCYCSDGTEHYLQLEWRSSRRWWEMKWENTRDRQRNERIEMLAGRWYS